MGIYLIIFLHQKDILALEVLATLLRFQPNCLAGRVQFLQLCWNDRPDWVLSVAQLFDNVTKGAMQRIPTRWTINFEETQHDGVNLICSRGRSLLTIPHELQL